MLNLKKTWDWQSPEKWLKIKTIDMHTAVIPEVQGTAEFTGRNEFWFNPEDPLKEGFIFR